DEEEEIERIVMEKGKKLSPEEARREANEKIDRQRIDREKAMESTQEIAEPIVEGDEGSSETASSDKGRDRDRGRGRGRGRDRDRDRDRNREEVAATPAVSDSDDIDVSEAPSAEVEFDLNVAEAPVIEFDDGGFERVADDEDTGEMFKDAYVQEAIIDRVRAVEFDIEEESPAEVGSLLASVAADGGFERIADEDEAVEEMPKKKPAKSRSKKAAAEAVAETASAPEKKSRSKKKADDTAEAKPKRSRSKKKADTEAAEEPLADADASVRESDETSPMAVRRGGRGRRRGGKGRKKEATDALEEVTEVEGDDEQETEVDGEVEIVFSDDAEAVAEPETEEASVEITDAPNAESDRGQQRNGRDDRNRDSRRGRGRDRDNDRPRERDNNQQRDRNDRNDRGDRKDRNGRDDRGERRGQPTISDLLREGQEILVQIAKEPIAKKGARITSHIALPGRFLVYMPTIEHVGVSRKIESSSERGRLRTLIQRIRAEEDVPSGGFIVRTAGIGISEEDLRQDARYLVRTWLDIKKTTDKAKSPAMVHQDLDLVQRLLRDQLSDDFAAIRVDSEEEYLRTVEFINRIQPKLVNRVKFYTREEPILEQYGVQEEIDKALKPRVWLKSGGYLVINQTEALVAIDVNTGKFVGKGNARLEDTITKTNMEAVDEIARQIRLRDLGGIIVLDLIDMEDRRNRHKVSQALQEALQQDKSPTKVLSFNDFGLIIMTRKRVKQSLERTMCAPCEYCEGAGWVKSPTTVCYEILSEARRLAKHTEDVRQTTLRVHPDVAKALRSSERSVLEEIEEHLGNVDVTADPHIHQAQYDFAFV
ncbi:MAG TPA: Rne/Rng family ribonuclease, partial [Pyrinomonadaceae bacterium]|nr:Rne/Rng family ribonuclease [Pyrinomonadaceae bacterium]